MRIGPSTRLIRDVTLLRPDPFARLSISNRTFAPLTAALMSRIDAPPWQCTAGYNDAGAGPNERERRLKAQASSAGNDGRPAVLIGILDTFQAASFAALEAEIGHRK